MREMIVVALIFAAWLPAKAVSDDFRPARLINSQPPEYPRVAQLSGQEGWVVLSYVITVDGDVRDVFVADSTGSPLFERAAKAAVKRFRYEPAQLDGVAIEHSESRFKITFQLEESEQAASPRFAQSFRRLQNHLERGNHEQAGRELNRMQNRPRLNLYEDAWYWWAKANYETRLGDTESARVSLRRAIAYEGVFLPPDIFLNALQLQFVDHARGGNPAAALRVYERIVEHDEAGDVSARLRPAVDELQIMLTDAPFIQVRGNVHSTQPWSHGLSRRSVELRDLTGIVSRLDFRCERRAESIEYAEGAAWHLPEAWGPCQVYVHANPGTSFTLIEYDPASL
ncbi:MAG: energy transducer TonB [Gammaproteobacteria bacterium]|nr:energy transducer TonB [Gammaproteobacteria bacterium]